MLKNLKQFVPEEVCLSCDGCCRFKDETSEWRPKVAAEELFPAVPGLADRILSKEKLAADGRLQTIICHGHHICSFFDFEKNTCGVYAHRPFDCQLYPFVLMKKQGRIVVAVHLNCPFIQLKRHTAEFQTYVDYLKFFFSTAETRRFLQDNPDLAGDYAEYRAELEEIFPVGNEQGRL